MMVLNIKIAVAALQQLEEKMVFTMTWIAS
jgi:hypothetical protein